MQTMMKTFGEFKAWWLQLMAANNITEFGNETAEGDIFWFWCLELAKVEYSTKDLARIFLDGVEKIDESGVEAQLEAHYTNSFQCEDAELQQKLIELDNMILEAMVKEFYSVITYAQLEEAWEKYRERQEELTE